MPFTARPTSPALVLCPSRPQLRGHIHSHRHALAGHKCWPLASRYRPLLLRNSVSLPRWQSSTAEVSGITHRYSQSQRPPPVRLISRVLVALACAALGFTMAAAPAIPTVRELLSPLTDEETLTSFSPDPSDPSLAKIEAELWAHPVVKSLLQDSNFKASRPLLKQPPSMRTRSLTAGTLMGVDKMSVPPLGFSTADGSHYVSVFHLGNSLCGHPGLVHGGMLATLLDEGLARCCFPALPNKVGVTASLKVDYRKPCQANSFIVLRAETTKVEGRKAWVKGRLETLVDESAGERPELLVEAEALFIEPKQAATMARILPVQ